MVEAEGAYAPHTSWVAKEVLGIPCSSAKPEMVLQYSVESSNVTKISNRMKPSKMEHLVVSAEKKQKLGSS